jgi:Oxygen-sensitive ribonucleoside-triphosphate reductase
MKVLKRDGSLESFNLDKITNAVKAAYKACGKEVDEEVLMELQYIPSLLNCDVASVETIQNKVERTLMDLAPYNVAKAYLLYREQHKESRFIRERLDYMENYANSTDNAATSSETDPNANVTQKNVANLEGEVYKEKNRTIQRQRMKDKLKELYPEVAKQYEKDLDSHIIYTHDEASSPTLKQYCMAVSLYPLLMDGVGNIDGVTPSEPNDLQSFSGQITNLTFLLSSQCKGAVAFGEYFIALNYYIIKEFGPKWYEKLDCITTTEHSLAKRTIRDNIHKAFKQFIYGVNQPAGNRSYQSPLRNLVLSNKFCIFAA